MKHFLFKFSFEIDFLKIIEKHLVESYKFIKTQLIISFIVLAFDVIVSLNLDILMEFIELIILVTFINIIWAFLYLIYFLFLLLFLINYGIDYFLEEKRIIIPKEASIIKKTIMYFATILMQFIAAYVLFRSVFPFIVAGVFSGIEGIFNFLYLLS